MIKNLSFSDLLANVGGVISSSSLNIILIIIFVILGYLLIKSDNKYNNYKRYGLIGVIMIILGVLIYYNNGLFKTLDYLANNLFMIFYFPNLLAYIIGLIVLNIVVFKTITNRKTDKLLKVVNTIVYLIIMYMSLLLMGIFSKSKLNVFALDDIYKNSKALSLIRLSSIIFIVWLLFIILYKIYLNYLNKKDLKLPAYKKSENKIKPNYQVKARSLPDYIKEIDYPKIVERDYKEYNIKEEELTNEFERQLSLDDYKLLVKLLLDHKTKEEMREKVSFKNLDDIATIKARIEQSQNEDSGVENMLEEVERIVTGPTLEQVMPIYKPEQEMISKHDEEVITKTVEAIEENLYQARRNSNVIEEVEKDDDSLKQAKIAELLRLYQE